MANVEIDYFRELPPLTSDRVAGLASGQALPLVLMNYVSDDDVGVLFPLEYIHRELVYRTPGKKDAVAFGVARLEDWGEFEEVRILFSRPNATATLRGLTLEGHVKARPYPPFASSPLRDPA